MYNHLQTVAIGYLLKVGFNQTYDDIEAHIKDNETLREHCPVLAQGIA